MQVTNNYQPSFRSLGFQRICAECHEQEVKRILYSKLPKQEADSFMATLQKSPVKTILGLADGKEIDRLDATVNYVDPKTKQEFFEYIEESKFRNLFNLKPRKFMNSVLAHVKKIENICGINKYA